MGGYQLEEIFNFRNFVIFVLILMIIYELLWLFLVVMDFFFKSISSAISGEPVKDFEAAEYIKYGIIFNIIFLLRDVITKKKRFRRPSKKDLCNIIRKIKDRIQNSRINDILRIILIVMAPLWFVFLYMYMQ